MALVKWLRANRKATGMILTALILIGFQSEWISAEQAMQYGGVVAAFTGVMLIDKLKK